jgi:hypothetical protein
VVSVPGDSLIDQQAFLIFKIFTGDVVGGICHLPSLPRPA